jgi:uncharacterized membrane protein (DUF485 family)
MYVSGIYILCIAKPEFGEMKQIVLSPRLPLFSEQVNYCAGCVTEDVTHYERGEFVMAKASYNWSEIARSPKYLELKRKKRVFLFGWWIAASIYYFSLPLLSGYFPALFKIKLIGVINFGYLFILSQFLVAIFVAMYYTKVANRDFDRLTDELVREIQ